MSLITLMVWKKSMETTDMSCHTNNTNFINTAKYDCIFINLFLLKYFKCIFYENTPCIIHYNSIHHLKIYIPINMKMPKPYNVIKLPKEYNLSQSTSIHHLQPFLYWIPKLFLVDGRTLTILPPSKPWGLYGLMKKKIKMKL